MLKKTVFLLITVLGIGGFFLGCQGSKKPLQFTQCQPEGKAVTLTEGQSQVFSCTVKSTQEAGAGLHYKWTRDGEAAGNGPDYTFFACGAASYAISLNATDDQGNSITQDWQVTLTPSAGAREACFDESLAAIHAGGIRVGYPDSTTDEVKLQGIQDCLQRSLDANICSVEGNYALALASISLALRNLRVDLQGNGGSVDPDLVEQALDNTLVPIRDHLAYAQEFAPESFSFFVENNFLVHLQDDDPETTDNESLTLNLFGNHDLSEVKFFLGWMEMITGMMSVGLSFNGLLSGNLPAMSISTNSILGGGDLLNTGVKDLIQNLINDPEYLNLAGPNGADGKARLLKAQAALADGLREIRSAYAHVLDEKTDQSWDLVRYWDCGKDSICPPDLSKFPNGDPAEPFEDCGKDGICPGDSIYTGPDSDGTEGNGKYDSGEPYTDLNQNGKWNDSWAKVGPDADGTEGNGKFDNGEPFGTEMVLEMGQLSLGGPVQNPEMVMNAFAVIADNIEGPDALLFGSFVPGGGISEQQIKLVLAGYGIPYPEIRLSQFFENPTSLRRMIPWYDKKALDFINDSECEPFYDWGYDWTLDSLETGYDAKKNPDPNHDDFNPLTNGSDKFDNNRNGKVDESSSFGITADLGPEGNLMFDWIDSNGNRRHDAGETSEKFDDIGVGPDHQGAGNGAWDCFDREHPYPTGPYVGGEPTEVNLDPLNTTSMDAATVGGDIDTSSTLTYMQNACIDMYYYFFPDPTFSGLLTFPDEISNKDGVKLTKNAKLARLFAKAIETVIEMNFIQVGIIK